MRALLPDAPNPQGWPYRLMITWQKTAWQPCEAGIATHAMSIMPPGQHHFRLENMGRDRFKVWLRTLRPDAGPNRLIVELWGSRLAYRGALIEAVGWKFAS